MINIKYFTWELYEKALSLSDSVKSYPRKDIKEAILEYHARVKAISNNKFIVLGKTNNRDYLFSVVHYTKKYTISPVFIRPMNEKEREHYESFTLFPY
jgi:uncharacterized DUF497 family protein